MPVGHLLWRSIPIVCCFLIGSFFNRWILSARYLFWIHVCHHVIRFPDIFPPFYRLSCLFHELYAFKSTSFKFWRSPIFLIWWCYLRHRYLVQGHKDLYLFSSRTFAVLALTRVSHLVRVNAACGVACGGGPARCRCLWLDVQRRQHHLSDRLFFLAALLGPLVENRSTADVRVGVWTPGSFPSICLSVPPDDRGCVARSEIGKRE